MPLGALAQLVQMVVGVGVRRRREQLAREPEHALRLVRLHQLVDDRLEVGEHLDFRERLRGGLDHGHPENLRRKKATQKIGRRTGLSGVGGIPDTPPGTEPASAVRAPAAGHRGAAGAARVRSPRPPTNR